jgi:hypothetical protein
MNDEQNPLIPIAEAGCAYLGKHPDASMIRVTIYQFDDLCMELRIDRKSATFTGAADEIARLVSQAKRRRGRTATGRQN